MLLFEDNMQMDIVWSNTNFAYSILEQEKPKLKLQFGFLQLKITVEFFLMKFLMKAGQL